VIPEKRESEFELVGVVSGDEFANFLFLSQPSGIRDFQNTEIFAFDYVIEATKPTHGFKICPESPNKLVVKSAVILPRRGDREGGSDHPESTMGIVTDNPAELYWLSTAPQNPESA
jgi:hypothetical protein